MDNIHHHHHHYILYLNMTKNFYSKMLVGSCNLYLDLKRRRFLLYFFTRGELVSSNLFARFLGSLFQYGFWEGSLHENRRKEREKNQECHGHLNSSYLLISLASLAREKGNMKFKLSSSSGIREMEYCSSLLCCHVLFSFSSLICT